jgi:hypothetical protein
MTSTKPSKKFYTAVNRIAKGDASLMGDIWSHGGTVTTRHPSGGRESGGAKSEIMGGRREADFGRHVELRDQVVHVGGDMAYEIECRAR